MSLSADTVEANQELGFAIHARNYQQCAEILFDLGLCKVRVMSNNPDKIAALTNAGLQVVERIAIEIHPGEDAADYLNTKREKLGHCWIFDDSIFPWAETTAKFTRRDTVISKIGGEFFCILNCRGFFIIERCF